MGFFRRRCETVLWKEVADWLASQVAQPELMHAGR
jgi:hypothetical protein